MKLQALILSLCILCATVASSQWTTSSNDIYNSNSGNVGIGTNSPGYKLHVDGQAKFNSSVWTDRLSIGAANVSTEQFYIYNAGSNVIVQNTSTGGYIRNVYSENGTSKFLIGYNLSGSDQKFGIYDYSTSANELVVDGGRIGIGTGSPGYKLDVNGYTRIQSTLEARIMRLDNGNGYYGFWSVVDGHGWAINFMGGADIGRINNTGIGIGKIPSYKLDVLNATTGQTSSDRAANFSTAGAVAMVRVPLQWFVSRCRLGSCLSQW